MQSSIFKRTQTSEHRKAQHRLTGSNLVAFNKEAKSRADIYIPVHPRGLYVMHPEDFGWCTELEKTDAWVCLTNDAHYNVGYNIMTEARVQVVVRKAIDYALEHMVDHPTLRRMKTEFDNISVAVMLHKGAESVLTKRDPDSWGLGQHANTFAPIGTGLVLMISLADTVHHDRRFKFTIPSKAYAWEVTTPHGNIVIFTGDA